MAAVAGSVADEIATVMRAAAPLRRLFVNNGGDIAIHLAEGESAVAGVVARSDQPRIAGTFRITDGDGVCGIATSGWRGRSQSRGIADAVTVLAPTAAAADAAATMIANAVDADHPAVRRAPARSVKDDSDLGDLEVTIDVGPLPPAVAADALAKGEAEAKAFLARGLICGAVSILQGQHRVVGSPAQAADDANMALIELRRMCVTVEEIRHEFGPPAAPPLRRASICAVLRNPYAGRYVPDILPMMEELKPFGIEMAQTSPVVAWRRGIRDRRLRQGRHRGDGRGDRARRPVARARRLRDA